MSDRFFDLKQVEKDFNIKNSDLSELLNVSHTLVSRYEQNPGIIPFEYILDLSEKYHFDFASYIKNKSELQLPIYKNKNDKYRLSFIAFREKKLAELDKLENSYNFRDFDSKTKKFSLSQIADFKKIVKEWFHLPLLGITGENTADVKNALALLLGVPVPRYDDGYKNCTFYISKNEYNLSLFSKYLDKDDTFYLKGCQDNINGFFNIENWYNDIDQHITSKKESDVRVILFDSPALSNFSIIRFPLDCFEHIRQFENRETITTEAFYAADLLFYVTDSSSFNLEHYKSYEIGNHITFMHPSLIVISDESYESFKSNIKKDDFTEITLVKSFFNSIANRKSEELFNNINYYLDFYFQTKIFDWENFKNNMDLNKIQLDLSDDYINKTNEYLINAKKLFIQNLELANKECQAKIEEEYKTTTSLDIVSGICKIVGKEDSDITHFPYNLKQLDEILFTISDFLYSKLIEIISDTCIELINKQFAYIDSTSMNNDPIAIFQAAIFSQLTENFKLIKEAKAINMITFDESTSYSISLIKYNHCSKSFDFYLKTLKLNFESSIKNLVKNLTSSVTTYARGSMKSKAKKISAALNSDYSYISNCINEYFKGVNFILEIFFKTEDKQEEISNLQTEKLSKFTKKLEKIL